MRDLCHLSLTDRTLCCQLQRNGLLLDFNLVILAMKWIILKTCVTSDKAIVYSWPYCDVDALKLQVEALITFRPHYWKMRVVMMPNLVITKCNRICPLGPPVKTKMVSWRLLVFSDSLLFVKRRLNSSASAVVLCTFALMHGRLTDG